MNFVALLSPNLCAVCTRATDLLTVRDAAERLSVSTAMVYKLSDRGDLPHVHVSNATRIALGHLTEFIACRETPPWDKSER